MGENAHFKQVSYLCLLHTSSNTLMSIAPLVYPYCFVVAPTNTTQTWTFSSTQTVGTLFMYYRLLKCHIINTLKKNQVAFISCNSLTILCLLWHQKQKNVNEIRQFFTKSVGGKRIGVLKTFFCTVILVIRVSCSGLLLIFYSNLLFTDHMPSDSIHKTLFILMFSACVVGQSKGLLVLFFWMMCDCFWH